MRYERYKIEESELDKGGFVPTDDDLWYICDTCDTTIPSLPEDSVGCKCGNIFIDADYHWLVVKDWSAVTFLERISED